MQNAYLDRPDREMLGMEERRRFDAWTPFHDRLTAQVIPRTAAVLAACRAAGVACLFARLACRLPDGRDRTLGQKRSGWGNPVLPRDARAAQVVAALAPRDGEVVVTKTADLALVGTGLRLILRNMGIETVVCAGVLTDQCVSSTVRSLADESFAAIVLEDCCAAGTEALHAHELAVINGVYGRVMGSGDFLGLLGEVSREPAEARHCLAPVRRPERASAEAEGGAAWTVGCHPVAAAPADASIASAPRRGGRGRILSTAKIRH